MAGTGAEGAEQSQGRQSGGADGKALADGGGRVADGVERVGALAHFRRQVRHFGETTSVVRDRAIRVHAQRNAEGREHADGRNGHAVNAGHVVGHKDRRADQKHRNRHGLHARRQTVDDVRRRTRFRLLGDVADRLGFGRGVVLGDLADQDADHKTGDHGDHERRTGAQVMRNADQLFRKRQTAAHREPRGRAGHQDRCDDHAAEQGAVQVMLVVGLDKEGADDRSNNAEGRNGEGQGDHAFHANRARVRKRAEGHRSDDRTDVGLEQVGAHAGDVADVVTDVVGDGARVAGVVFGNARFDLANEVGADVGRFREDAATNAREQCDRRGAKAKAEDLFQAHRRKVRSVEHREPGDAEQRQANHAHAHDHARAERNAQCIGQAVRRGLRRAHGRAGRGVHAEVAGDAGRERTAHKRDGGVHAQALGFVRHGDRHKDDDHEHGKPFVFGFEESGGAFLDLLGDALHHFVAVTALHDREVTHDGEHQRDASGDKGNWEEIHRRWLREQLGGGGPPRRTGGNGQVSPQKNAGPVPWHK